MKTYLRLYRWSMQMKLYMSLYTFAAIFLKAICSLLHGVHAIAIMDLLTIWLTCLLFAIVESAIFPKDCEYSRVRSALWFAAANICFIGGALVFDWFSGVPVWGAVLLIIVLELGLGMTWFGDRFVLKTDSTQLKYQHK